MGRVNLTAGRIRDFATDKAQSFLWDSAVAGLAVRATAPSKNNPGGLKAFTFQAALPSGNDFRVTIGDVQSWGIDAARAEARRLKTLIDQKIDPRIAKLEEAEARLAKQVERGERHAEGIRRDVAALAVWEIYISARRYKWSGRHLADHQNLAHAGGEPVAGRRRLSTPGALSALLSLPLSEIHAASVKAWLRDEAIKRPTQAALAYRLLRAFLNWCSDTPEYAGIAAANACQARVAKDILPKKSAKDDCLQKEQLPAWFGFVKTISNPVISSYLQILLLIGSRREELASLMWEDVDFRWQSITIHDKVDGERTIPLTPYVAALLSNLKKRNDTPPPKHRILCGKKIENDLVNWKPSPWVFSSPTAESGRLQEPSIQHRRACVSAGIEGLTLHGLRRSFGTLAEWVECPTGVSAQIMGHKPSALAEKHYRVRPLDLLRSWHSKIEAWILTQAGIQLPEDSVQGLHVVKVA